MYAQAFATTWPVPTAPDPAGLSVLAHARPRVGRRLDQVDTADLLRRMASLRSELGRVRRQLCGGSIPDLTFSTLLRALDGSAELITGDASFLADR